MDLPAFNPTPSQADAALDALADPTRSLLDIAAANHTSIRALSAWLQSPEIRPHADLIDEALTRRARTQAALAFPAAIAAATTSIEAFNQLPIPNLADKDPAAADHYRAHCQAALRAASILLRIARFDPTPPRRRAQHEVNDPGHRHRAEHPSLAELAALLASPSDARLEPAGRSRTRGVPTPLPPATSMPAPAPSKPAVSTPGLSFLTPKGWTDIAGGGAQAARPERHPRRTPAQSGHPEGVLGANAHEPARSPPTAATLAATAGLASGP